jgi:cell wall-associated NlpC family hydrolase
MQLSPIPSQKKGHIHRIISRFRKVSWRSPKAIAGLCTIVLVTGGLTYYLSTTTSAAAVMINGQQIGLVRNVNTGETLVQEVLELKGKSFGQIAKTHDQVTYGKVRIKSAVYLESVLNKEKLQEHLNYYLEGYKVEADGSIIAYLPTKADADKVLQEYEAYYVKPSDENRVTAVNFAEKVSVEAVEIEPTQITQIDQAFKMLIDGKVITKDYTVQPNDSWWLIARKNDMLTDEVLAGNPGATKDTKLQPGQVVKLVNTTPYLTVISQGTYSGSETIPFDVVTKTDNSLGPGQAKVITQGSNGSKLVTYSYEQKNGIDVSKQVLEEKITQAPVNQVVAKGPNKKPVMVAYTSSRGSNGSSSIVDRALSLQGTSYVFGGTNKSGFDCSGFTKYVFSGSGISLPRTSYDQFASGTPISKDNLQPGDLVFFTTYAKGASHVGIYIGGGRFVHASNPSSGVKTSGVSDSFYGPRYLGARRY